MKWLRFLLLLAAVFAVGCSPGASSGPKEEIDPSLSSSAPPMDEAAEKEAAVPVE